MVKVVGEDQEQRTKLEIASTGVAARALSESSDKGCSGREGATGSAGQAQCTSSVPEVM